MTARWTFTDNVSSATYLFPINPNEGGSPVKAKNVTQRTTSAPDGIVLVAEGRDSPQTFTFSGVLLEQAQYDAFDTWYEKRHQIEVTDDLGRTFSIYITKWEPKRVRSAAYDWKHTYSIEAVILDVPS